MVKQKARGWQRVVNAFGYSLKGFQACFDSEEAFRQEVWLLIPLVPLALWLGDSPVERALLVGALLLVPIVELLNSAIETTVDRFGLEHHDLSGRAKDIASAAVFSSIVFCVVIWALILIPKWI